jgi:tRNA pseudouridine32 synthase / 23S rRNA pseudouridine746 synthase
MHRILYEDDTILAVDKPVGLSTIPERQAGKECLVHQLSAQYPLKIFVVHRLDKEVSGVILFAKNAPAHAWLNEQFNQRQVRKTYLALVHGIPDRDCAEIDKPIRLYGSGRMAVDWQRGKECLTVYQVREKFRNHSLVAAYPRTGRRHQIRVHLYSIGHPIAGDPLYGEKQHRCQQAFPRLMLHAQTIEFRLVSGEEIKIESPLPELFLKVIQTVDTDKKNSDNNKDKA